MLEVASNPLKKILAAEKKHWSTVRRHVQLQLMMVAMECHCGQKSLANVNNH